MTQEEIKQELSNQMVRLNSLLFLAHETGMRPKVLPDVRPYKDENVAQLRIET